MTKLNLNNQQAAFSLVEMLMALLVASLLLAALAPVMTRKMNENVIVSGTGNAVMLQGGCVFMEGNHENVCRLPQNTLSIGAIIASGGGGGGGAAKAAFGAVRYSDVINGTTVGAVNSNTITLNKNSLNVSVQLVGGGGGGGLGSSNEGGYPKNQADCGSWGVYIGPEYEGAGDTTLPNAAKTHPSVSSGYHSICVSRRNPELNGTNNAPKINVSGVEVVTANGTNTCSAASNASFNCCFAGQTTSTDSNYCNSSLGDYSGCNRSLCQWNAAKTVCSNWKPVSAAPEYGRLPRKAEVYNNGWLAGMNAGILNKPNNSYQTNYPGLQFCGSMVSSYYSLCRGVDNCKRPSKSGCYPREVWTNDFAYSRTDGMKVYSTLISHDTNGMFSTGGNDMDYPFGVRCVLDRISSFSFVAGGGGGAGLYAEMKISNDVIRKALSEGTVQITYTAGGGGKGAYATSSSNYIKLSDTSKTTSAVQGVRSSAALTVNGITKWEFSVPGGKPGGNASINTAGKGGEKIDISSNAAVNACYYKNSYSTNASYRTGGYFSCSSINDGGVIPDLNMGSAGVNGGAGGSGYFAGVSKTGGGINSTPSYGGGGGGGASTSEGPTREYAVFNTAGNGGGGMARVTYKYARPGAGGGGGGAGAVVHIPNITTAIRPDTTFNIQVGAGGQGGAAGGENDGSNGTQGGTSSIEWRDGNTVRYVRLTGGEGGKKGVIGKPDDGTNGIDSTPGAAGTVKPVLSLSAGVAGKNDYIMYPSDLTNTKGHSVVQNTDYTVNYYAAPGGNGGINSKISPVDKKPCGGWSNVKIDYYGAKDINNDDEKFECKLRNSDDANNPYAGSFTPYLLSVTNEDPYRPDAGFKANYAYVMSKANEANFAGNTIGGSTGGGGGGWKWFDNEAEQAYAGANGMPGFVIIYWNLQEENAGS